MSAEKIIYEEQNQTVLKTSVLSEVKFSGHVDINDLLTRARKIKEKETLTNIVFTVLILSVIFIFGIILSF